MERLTIAEWDDPALLEKVLQARADGHSITIAPPEAANLPTPDTVVGADGLFNYRGHGASWSEVNRVVAIMKNAIGEDAGLVACSYGIWHLYAIVARIASAELGNPWLDVMKSTERGLPPNFCADENVACLVTTSATIAAVLDTGGNVNSLRRVIVLDAPSDSLTAALEDISLVSIENFCAAWKAGADRIA